MPKKKSKQGEVKKSIHDYMDVIRLPRAIRKRYSPRSDAFTELLTIKPTERGQVHMYGKLVNVPRTEKSYLRDYTFSQVDHHADPTLPPVLISLFDWAQNTKYAKTHSGSFNQVFINWYENGHQYIGAHSDNESQLKKDSEIISVSFGATRLFRIRDKEKKIVHSIKLRHGDVVIMKPGMQSLFTHEIVKVSGKVGLKIDWRINVTFRKFVE